MPLFKFRDICQQTKANCTPRYKNPYFRSTMWLSKKYWRICNVNWNLFHINITKTVLYSQNVIKNYKTECYLAENRRMELPNVKFSKDENSRVQYARNIIIITIIYKKISELKRAIGFTCSLFTYFTTALFYHSKPHISGPKYETNYVHWLMFKRIIIFTQLTWNII